MKKLITAADLRQMAGVDRVVLVPKDGILTPSAKDLAKELGVEITWEDSLTHLCLSSRQVGTEPVGAVQPSGPDDAPGATECCSAGSTGNAGKAGTAECSPAAIGPDELKNIVARVLGETLRSSGAGAKVTHVRGDQVVIEPFNMAPPGEKIGLRDVITAKDGNLCAGFMTFDHAHLPWKLTYDEIDYVIEGDFTLKAGDREYVCKPGDVISIPNGTEVVFGSPTRAKVFYVTYPANWADSV